MLEECLEWLNLQPKQWYIDATFGAGGHTKAMLEAGVKVLAIDQDPHTQAYMARLKQDLADNKRADFLSVQGNFEDLVQHVNQAGLGAVAGILMDLGVSSMQLDEGERGFAFRKDGPLDMRMQASGDSAADVVNHYEQEDLAAIIFKYGEERYSRRIARAIVEERAREEITTTQALAAIIQRAYPKGSYRRDHPARRTFQALRIYVNDELGVLERALKGAESVLAEQGRLVVMSYHSLEDRIVKHFMRSSEFLTGLTKKPLLASEAEAERNPRARSAKLRVAERSVR
ncbi:MAG: 16S rRNA (cytosine(1402)-N(4))-methyltransferase RsmH [Trueperaceae bacterium]|nr:16S rRNA (cytosine(1402)-N(4))-methyltransferase RsmH [Trueperaceae bacterium]